MFSSCLRNYSFPFLGQCNLAEHYWLAHIQNVFQFHKYYKRLGDFKERSPDSTKKSPIPHCRSLST